MSTEEGTRLVFNSWNDGNKSASRTITQGGEYLANHTTQYKLDIESPYGNPKGAGWYDSESIATISINPTEGKIIQHIFTGWSGDLTGQETTASVIMNKPKTIKAEWETDYLWLYVLIFGFIALIGITATVVIYINKKKSL